MAKKQSLYPDILFHFTSRDGLYGILRDTFSVSYSAEKIIGDKKSVAFSVPMVSFCDLKLSELKTHMDKYGNYGIGLTKEWANKNGLNPVFYVNKNSHFTGNFTRALREQLRQVNLLPNGKKADAIEHFMGIFNIYRYMKNYEGDLKRWDGKTTRNYRFADEREWRYVPPWDGGIPPFLGNDKMSTPQDKRRYNAEISHLKLRFQPDDIKYLIIESDHEITELIHHLDSSKLRFDEDTKRRLASRILTSEQIRNDV